MDAKQMDRAKKQARFTDIFSFLDKLAREEGRIMSGRVLSPKRLEAQRRRWLVAPVILDGNIDGLLKKIAYYSYTEKERKLLSDAQLRDLGFERNPMSLEAQQYRAQQQRNRRKKT